MIDENDIEVIVENCIPIELEGFEGWIFDKVICASAYEPEVYDKLVEYQNAHKEKQICQPLKEYFG